MEYALNIDQEMNFIKINDIVPVTTKKQFGRKLISNGKVQSMRITQEMVNFHYSSQNCDLSEIQSVGGNDPTKSGSFKRPKSKTPNKTQSRRGSQINIEQIDSSKESLLPPLHPGKGNKNMKCPDLLSNRITAASDAPYSATGTPRMSKSYLGSFTQTPVMQSGKFVLPPNKAKDGFINTQVSFNVGPGPAKHSKRESIGCTHGTIGNTRRFLNLSQYESSPGPDIYNPHKKMTDIRTNTREKNSPNCRFTTEKKHFPLGPITPGPSCYATQICQQTIGDKASVKVPFNIAQRFQGDRPQTQILGNQGGYIRRRSELPSSFNMSSQKSQTNKRPNSIETSHSPAAQFRKPPMATFGNTKRNLIDAPISKVPVTPGPSDYKIQRAITYGPKFHMAQRYKVQLKGVPGPSDYNYDPMQTLKRSPVGTIGKYKEPSFVACKEHSPGPADYQPRVTNTDFKKMRITKLNREKRFSSLTGEKLSPGPVCFFKPPRF